MKKHLLGAFFVMMATTALSQTVTNDADGLFDSTSYVETDSTTNNTTTSNVTTDNTNTNTSTITSTNTNNNTNTNTSTITSTNTNNNTNTNTNTSTNTNTNTNTSTSTVDQTTDSTINQTVNQTTDSTVDQTVNTTSNITTDNTNRNINTSTSTNQNTNINTNDTTINSTADNTNTNVNTNDSTITQEVISPPPSAIAPSIQSGGNDTCTVSYSAAVQTQILGVSGGGHIRDMNCERMKLSKLLNDYGMKVAAVAILCQDPRVFEAMEQAGTPCPFEGKIGKEAMQQWNKYDVERPDYETYVEKMDIRLEIDEKILREEGILQENENLKTSIKDISKDNKKLEKEIKKLQEMQVELLNEVEEELDKTEVSHQQYGLEKADQIIFGYTST